MPAKDTITGTYIARSIPDNMEEWGGYDGVLRKMGQVPLAVRFAKIGRSFMQKNHNVRNLLYVGPAIKVFSDTERYNIGVRSNVKLLCWLGNE